MVSSRAFSLIWGNKRLAGSAIGGMAETQEMLDHSGKHGIVSDVDDQNVVQEPTLTIFQPIRGGMMGQLANRMFDAFYTTKPDGIGMGLSISRTIIEQHGGRLWAVPNDGFGATFQFTL